MPSGVPVIVEGVSATDVRLPVPWDITLWVEVPAAVRRARIAERDGPALRERWLTDWIPMEEAYAADQRPWDRVDLVHVPDDAPSVRRGRWTRLRALGQTEARQRRSANPSRPRYLDVKKDGRAGPEVRYAPSPFPQAKELPHGPAVRPDRLHPNRRGAAAGDVLPAPGHRRVRRQGGRGRREPGHLPGRPDPRAVPRAAHARTSRSPTRSPSSASWPSRPRRTSSSCRTCPRRSRS